jgi:bifunctional DNA primase/polymerase-like protein
MPLVVLIPENKTVLRAEDDLGLSSPAPAAAGDATAEVIPLRAATGPYARGACSYLAAGYSPLPLPRGQKAPPPNGWTGQDAPMAWESQVQAWLTRFPDANVALRLPPGVVGIDVDAYKGEDASKAWAALLDRLGPLPLAPWCSARDDGLSGIRLFRVPPGYAPSDRGMGSAGEVIWHGHRYVVAPPSVHPDPGQVYRWVYPNKRKGGPQALLAANLPELPVGWLEALRSGTCGSPDTAAMGGPIQTSPS